MPERSDIRLLCGDITEAVERILRYISNMTYDEFLADTRTQDAVTRNLEILGEAVKNLPEPFKNSIPKFHGASSLECETNSSTTISVSVLRSSGKRRIPTSQRLRNG